MPRIINIRESWGISTHVNENGSFVITFAVNNLKVNLHCDRSSLRFLTQELWEVIESEEKQIADMKAAMTGE